MRLKYCASLVNEKTDGFASELPYTGLEHIESWTGKRVQTGEKPEAEGQASKFCGGDLLFGKLRPYLAKVFRSDESGICTGELLVLRTKNVSRDYLFYYVLARDFISIVDSSTYGAKMPRASWEFIGNLPALVPSDNEQRAIAAFLDRETGRIDGLIEKKERQIELLQEKRAAVITHAVTKGLDPKAPMKDSGIEWLGEIPAHWTIRQLKYVATFQRGHDLPDSVRAEGAVPVVTSGGISGSHDEYRAKGPGIVTGRYGTIGTIYYVEDDFWPHNTTLYCSNSRGNNMRFLWYLLQNISGFFLLNAGKSAVPGVDRNDLHPIPVAIPVDVDEQKEIAGFLDRETVKGDALCKRIDESIAVLREYRTALISAAVTGKIDVRPADGALRNLNQADEDGQDVTVVGE